MSHLNNGWLLHNNTIESIMFIFTQFQTTCCLRCLSLKVRIPSGREHCSLSGEIRQVDFSNMILK